MIDRVVQNFLQRVPDAIIVTLGAGFCTRFFRYDNGTANWFGVDLEAVAALWQQWIGESERNHFIACSVTDFSWMETIKQALSVTTSHQVLAEQITEILGSFQPPPGF